MAKLLQNNRSIYDLALGLVLKTTSVARQILIS